MKIRLLLTLSILILSLSSCQKDFDQTQPPPSENYGMVEGTIRMKLDRETADALQITRTRSGELATGNISFDELCQRYHIIEMKRLFDDNGCAERTRKAGLDLWYTITFEGDGEQIKKDFGELPGVTHVEVPLRIKRAYQMHPASTSPSVYLFGSPIGHAVPSNYPFNDPLFEKQWPLYNDATINTKAVSGADINVLPAWEATAGRNDVIVAVVDEGVQYNHPDLVDNMWSGIGRNFCSGNNSTITWGEGHGTHVAGTIAAVNNNGIGISGIAGGTGKSDGVKIMTCQIFHPTNGVYDADSDQTAQAIKYAADNGAVICQNSWGYEAGAFGSESQWASYDRAIKEAIDYFVEYAGMSPDGETQTGPMAGGIVTFAAGNEYSSRPSYPAAYSACISVSSISCNYEAASYTNYGSTVDIAAPGGGAWASASRDIPYAEGYNLSTIPTDLYNGQKFVYTTYDGFTETTTVDYVEETGYGYMQGTSMACPHVSGVAALIISRFGQMGFTSEQCKEILLGTTRNIDSYQPSRYVGKIGQLVDAGAALGYDLPPAPDAPTITPAGEQSDSFVLLTTETKTLSYTLANYTDWSLNDESNEVESSIAGDVVTLSFNGELFAPGKYVVELIAMNGSTRATRTISFTVVDPSDIKQPVITPASGQEQTFTMGTNETKNLIFTLTDYTDWELIDRTGNIGATISGNKVTLVISGSAYTPGSYSATLRAINVDLQTDYTINYTIEAVDPGKQRPTIKPEDGQSDSFTMAADEVKTLRYTLSNFTQWSLTDETNLIDATLDGNLLTLTIDASKYTAGSYTARINVANGDLSVARAISYKIEADGSASGITMDLYPNPCVDVLNFRANQSGTATIRIRNSVGLEIMNQSVVFTQGRPLSLDVSKFASGAYMVDINFDGTNISRTVIKR